MTSHLSGNTHHIYFALFFGLSRRYALVFFLLQCINVAILAQDSTPPTIISPSRDTSFACMETDLTSKLSTWYNQGGFAEATDDSGIAVTYVGHITLDSALTVFEMSSDTLCGNTKSVSIVFYAVDGSGNQSLPMKARFFTIDDVSPTINVVPNVSHSCVQGIRDTLINWIKNKGGYIATDACSEPIRWTRFLYSISQNNISIQSGSGLIDSGPYPMIPDSICDWRLNINFFALDDCGNEVRTPGTTTFSVHDDIAPVFIFSPEDTVVDCHNIPIPSIQIQDYCDRSPQIAFSTSSTQDQDTLSCGHYNYTLIRTWVVSDACNNSVTHQQTLTVIDTIPPKVESNVDQNMSCSAYDSLKTQSLISVNDFCGQSIVTFNDSLIFEGCISQYKRTYFVSDACDNRDTIFQNLYINNNQKPIIITDARDLAISCENSLVIQDSLVSWIENKGYSEANEVCDPISYFIASHGTYDIEDESTYPGLLPTTFPSNACPSDLLGYLASLQLDVVYHDTCGNASATSAIIGIVDTIQPTIIECSEDMVLFADAQNCSKIISLPVPKATDNCVDEESPIIRTNRVLMTSNNPGNQESIINEATIKIGPISPNSSILSDGVVNIKLVNLDIDDATEFFNILDEDGTILGTTPTGIGQCASADIQVILNKDKLTQWQEDGFITLKFVPNIVLDNPILSINDICNGSFIETSLMYEVEVTNAIEKWYTIDEGGLIAIASGDDSISINLSAGNHEIKFGFSDCALNTSYCITSIEIRDTIAPKILCHDVEEVFVAPDSCSKQVVIPLDIEVMESCGGNVSYDAISPLSKEAALITFQFNAATDKHEARSKQLIFNNVFAMKHMSNDVLLEIYFNGNNYSTDAYFEIYGPGGYFIGNTNPGTTTNECDLSISTFYIPAALFNTWIVNKQVTLAAVPHKSNNQVFIYPCSPLTSAQTLDNVSYLQGRLNYSDVNFQIKVNGATDIPQYVLPQDAISESLSLNAGTNTITLYAEDNAGNLSSCQFNVMVLDTIAPVARCKDAVIFADPSGTVITQIDPTIFDDESMDNCRITDRFTLPASISCNDIGDDRVITLYVKDEFENVDSCSSHVRIFTKEIKPTYSSGLCANDTLKFKANVETADKSLLSYHWVGPNSIEFFTENPEVPNATTIYNGTYILTVTGYNGCTAQGSVVVNINPITKPIVTPSNAIFCEEEQVVLSATDYSGNITYKWYEGIYPTGILIAENSNNEIMVTPIIGVHFYYVIVDGPNCVSDPSAVVKITVLKQPIVAVDDTFLTPCEGDNITFSTSVSNPNYSFMWSGPSGYAHLGQTPPMISNVTKANEGKYLLVIKNGECVSDTAAIIVTVFERPPAPTITGNAVFCKNGNMILTSSNASNADKFEWILNGTVFRVTQQNILNLTDVQSNFEGEWQVRAIKGNCASPLSQSKNVTIEDLTDVSVSYDGPICEGDSLQLLASFIPDASYKWQGPITNIPNVFNPKTLGKTGVYVVTISTPSGCTNSVSTSVDITSVPKVTALSHDGNLCMDEGDEIILSPSVFPDDPSYSYQWAGPNGFTSSDRNPVIAPITQIKSGEYSLIVGNHGCNSEASTLDVSFTIRPIRPIIMGDTSICSGENILLTANEDARSKFIWQTPLGAVTTDTGFIDILFVSPSHSGFYAVSQSLNGCKSVLSDSIYITVNALPPNPTFDVLPNPVCFGSDFELKAPNYQNMLYVWSGPDNFTSTLPNPKIVNASQEKSGAYSLYISSNGCRSMDSSIVEVIVMPEITTPEPVVQSFDICDTDPLFPRICINPITVHLGSTNVLYDVNGQEVVKTQDNCFDIPPNYIWQNGSNYFYIRASIGNCQSSASQSIVVNKNAPPNIKATALNSDLVVCPNENIQLTAVHDSPSISYNWFSGDENIQFSAPNSRTTFVSGIDDGINVAYLSYSSVGCRDYSIDTIYILKEITPTAVNDVFTIGYDNIVTLPVLQNDDILANGQLVSVTVNVGNAEINNNEIVYTPDIAGIQEVVMTYTICSEFCELCDEASVTLHYDDDIACRVPNIITPNGDGINDELLIPCLLNAKYEANTLTIFNEWGNEVYQSSPYKNDWQGTYKNEALPVGTYFYILEINGIAKPINGFLIIQK